MKQIILSSLTFFTILILSACGGSSSTDTTATVTTANSISIPIEACVSPSVISSYQTLKSGDVIIDDAGSSSIKTYHDLNNNKYVCLASGTAHIARPE